MRSAFASLTSRLVLITVALVALVSPAARAGDHAGAAQLPHRPARREGPRPRSSEPSTADVHGPGGPGAAARSTGRPRRRRRRPRQRRRHDHRALRRRRVSTARCSGRRQLPQQLSSEQLDDAARCPDRRATAHDLHRRTRSLPGRPRSAPASDMLVVGLPTKERRRHHLAAGRLGAGPGACRHGCCRRGWRVRRTPSAATAARGRGHGPHRRRAAARERRDRAGRAGAGPAHRREHRGRPGRARRSTPCWRTSSRR